MSRLHYARKRLQQLLKDVWRGAPANEGDGRCEYGEKLSRLIEGIRGIMKESRHSNSRELSEQQQLLLMSLHDGECGVFSRWRANRLVSQSPKAAEFIATLDAISEGIDSSVAGEVPQLAGSLWEGISRRIEQEERAALFLGERRVRSAEPRVNRRILAPLGWSVAGDSLPLVLRCCFSATFNPRIVRHRMVLARSWHTRGLLIHLS